MRVGSEYWNKYLLVFKDGQAVERMVGLMPKSSIITNIEKYI